MALGFEPLSAHTGARVRGVDLARPVEPGVAAALRAALARHGVLVLPGQALDEAAQVAACRLFGEPHAETGPDGRPRPRIRYVSNDPAPDARRILPAGEIHFHSDQCFAPEPYSATTLHAIEAPAEGGETLFANAVAAFRDLPDALRGAALRHSARHVYDGARTQREDAPAAGGMAAVHPVAVAHPVTGAPVLFVNRLMTAAIEGLPGDEGGALLARLLEHVERPCYRIAHRWSVGDFVIWDNIALQHGRSDFPPTTRRVLRRIAVAGGRLAAA